MVSPAISSRFTCVRPTAQASVGLLALTAARLAVFPAVAGVLTCDQAVPFQLSMTGFAPTPLSSAFSLPTAQASEALTALTPDGNALCRVGGTGTMAQPVAASAGLAMNTTAADKATQMPILKGTITSPSSWECSAPDTHPAAIRSTPGRPAREIKPGFIRITAAPSARRPGARCADYAGQPSRSGEAAGEDLPQRVQGLADHPGVGVPVVRQRRDGLAERPAAATQP